MVRARIPELGEYVQMGEFATPIQVGKDYYPVRGWKGQVIKIDEHHIPKVDPLGNPNGHGRTDLYIAMPVTYNGKRVVVRASPYELDGGILE